MLTPHTPGPWMEGPTDGIGQRGKLIVVDSKGFKVADCEAWKVGLTFQRPLPQDEANVRLIIAAPEMLETLKACHEYLSGILAPCEPGCDCLVEITAALIAKAEGSEARKGQDAATS